MQLGAKALLRPFSLDETETGDVNVEEDVTAEVEGDEGKDDGDNNSDDDDDKDDEIDPLEELDPVAREELVRNTINVRLTWNKVHLNFHVLLLANSSLCLGSKTILRYCRLHHHCPPCVAGDLCSPGPLTSAHYSGRQNTLELNI